MIRINCLKAVDSRFKFVCPKTWAALTATREDGVKFCDECKKNVYLCNSEADFQNCATKGQCAALKTDADNYVVMGEPRADYGIRTSLDWE